MHSRYPEGSTAVADSSFTVAVAYMSSDSEENQEKGRDFLDAAIATYSEQLGPYEQKTIKAQVRPCAPGFMRAIISGNEGGKVRGWGRGDAGWRGKWTDSHVDLIISASSIMLSYWPLEALLFCLFEGGFIT